eukprot:snap_masked-scaffold_35-processed-gene-1.17-mRNA-1 protein AED:1.00 eAED:1.00 QI:0/-1/0/0/-1/1/1/0/62
MVRVFFDKRAEARYTRIEEDESISLLEKIVKLDSCNVHETMPETNNDLVTSFYMKPHKKLRN